jgi:hypothetical protein
LKYRIRSHLNTMFINSSESGDFSMDMTTAPS